MSFYNTLKFIVSHPLNKKNPVGGLLRFGKWQLKSRFLNRPIICNFATKSKLLVSKGMTGATQNIYCGLQEFNDMAFLLHFLRDTDQFIDIGANVGSYSILASSEIGAITYAVEPVPKTFESLQKNIRLNNSQDITNSFNMGVGSTKGKILFTAGLDTMNHVAVEGEKNTIEVLVDTFDNLFELNKTTLVKIDTEGFESAVLEGMEKSISNKNLQAIIIELNGLSKRYGYDDNKIHNKLIESGFKPYDYDPFTRTLDLRTSYGKYNTLYLRDFEFILNRVQTAPLFEIHNTEF